MAQTSVATGPAPLPSHSAGTSLTRSAVLASALAVGAALGTQGPAIPMRDAGTRVGNYTDVSTLAKSTSLQRLQLDGRFSPFVESSTMARIRTLAPLSLREWGRIFGVSHTAIGDWVRQDPNDREDLRTVLAALEEAAKSKGDLSSWLLATVPGLQVRPVDLLKDRRWRAFRGALSAGSAPDTTISPSDLAARRRAETSWAIADLEIERDGEE